MTRIKICGMREASDAMVAAQAGADFVGLVFVPGNKRRLEEDEAIHVVSTLREKVTTPPSVVGLFADQPLQEVNRLARRCGLDMAQLCGNESLDYCGQVIVSAIKVLHVSDSLVMEDAISLLSEKISALRERGHLVTLDRKVAGLPGGSGQSFNWDIAGALSTRSFPFLLAGGLTPENVAQAVRTVHPWGIDVSSGVETGGVKDQEKIRAFISAVRPMSPET